jgi:hypothetical protein
MIPGLLLAVAGVAAIIVAEVIARRSPAQRIGRTLAAARNVPVQEALRIAQAGEPRYVLVHGRISSDEEFPDENDRPLVYRRRRIDVRDASGRWQIATPAVEGVPFGVESRDDYIAVDSAQLGAGLVVVPREAVGVVADLPSDIAPATPTDPQTPARLVVEQVSAVEHASVAGVPSQLADGTPAMSSGLGRPLIVTTLELPEALRLLGTGRRATALLTAVLIVVGVMLIGVGLLLAIAAPALAASPTPEPLPTPFDPRGGGGAGEGTVGGPFLALLAVVGLGVLTAVVTALLVRLGRTSR